MRWLWRVRHRDGSNGADEARSAASDALTAAHERSGEVDQVTRAAWRQAARSDRYLAELDAIYHLRRGEL